MDPHTTDRPDAPESRGLFAVLRRRLGLILAGGAAGLALGLAYAFVATPLFQSNAQVLVVQKRPEAIPGAAAAASPHEDYLATQQGLVKSPLVLQRAVDKHHLAGLRSFAAEKEEPLAVLMRNLTVSRSKDPSGGVSNILVLSYKGPVAEECSQILDAVLESYQEVLAEAYQQGTATTVELIRKAHDVLRQELSQKEAGYAEFRRQAPLFGGGRDGVNPRQERLTGIDVKRTELLLQKAELQSRLDALVKAEKEGRSREALLAMAADYVRRPVTPQPGLDAVRTVQEALAPLVQQEQDLRQRYGPNHPEVKAVRNRIEATRDLLTRPTAAFGPAAPGTTPERKDASLSDPVGWYTEHLRQQIDQVDSAEKMLSGIYKDEQEEARQLGVYQVQDEMMRADIARTQLLYENVVKQLKEADLILELGGYDAKVIAAPGSGGVKKVEPNAIVLAAITGLLCVLGGAGLGFLGEVLDRGYRSAAEVRRDLGAPVLGVVPLAGHPRAVGGVKLHASLATLNRPQSAEAEAYRDLRMALAFGARGKGQQVIQVTSPRPGEGATTLAANLAVALAQSGRRVALVDANLRDPRVQELFALAPVNGHAKSNGAPHGPEAGLASLLKGDGEFSEAVLDSGVDRLSILPAGSLGTGGPQPGELLESPRLEELLTWLREWNHVVIVDTPALLAGTDARVVAPRVDGVLLNLRLGRDVRARAARARELLSHVPAKLLGVVLTGAGKVGAAL